MGVPYLEQAEYNGGPEIVKKGFVAVVAVPTCRNMSSPPPSMQSLACFLRAQRPWYAVTAMQDAPAVEPEAILARIKSQVATGAVRVTQRAHQGMVEEEIKLDEVLEAIREGEILELYPDHRRGACCLLTGNTRAGRPLHVVCTTAQPLLILITVYEPKPPKWGTPRERRRQP
jgi:hypothetical protein